MKLELIFGLILIILLGLILFGVVNHLSKGAAAAAVIEAQAKLAEAQAALVDSHNKPVMRALTYFAAFAFGVLALFGFLFYCLTSVLKTQSGEIVRLSSKQLKSIGHHEPIRIENKHQSLTYQEV